MAQNDGNEKASEAPETAISRADQSALDKIEEMSIQARTTEASSLTTWFFFGRSCAEDDEIAPWWSENRDRDLRDFVKEPGNDILAGAVSSIVKKFVSMNWTLEGPKAEDPDAAPPGTVDHHQKVLSSSEFGAGWGTLLRKSLQDYVTQDKGLFWELIGPGDLNGPIEMPGVLSIAHLDAAKCQLTGDPTYPVIFHNPKTDSAHRLHATRVAHASDMTSPNEDMNGVGFCAVSRVEAASQILLKLNRYKNEKLSDLPEAGLLLLNNVLPTQWEEVRSRYQAERRKLGHEFWANVMTLLGIDPQQPVSAELVSFANLPDAFNEKDTIDIYVNVVALAFGVDAREFWPISTGALGTATETLIQHQKARGKGVGDLISTLERIINWKVLPPSVSFFFDFREDEEDAVKAGTIKLVTETIMSMWEPRKGFGGVDEGPVTTRQEIRQMLADHVPYFKEEFLVEDTTLETQVTDIERRGYGRRVRMDSKGRVCPIRTRRKARRVDEVLSVVEDNYRQGLIEAESLAEFAVAELLDRREGGF